MKTVYTNFANYYPTEGIIETLSTQQATHHKMISAVEFINS